MILTGKEIEKRLGKDIIIEPYVDEQLNPNSYNLRLHNELLIYKGDILDPKINNETETLLIPEEGLIIEPGQLYLARTLEYTETQGLVPMILGRSSVGRLGITVHITSGFGDVGFCGYWTLQLTCVKKVRIYPNMKICQIFYHDILGEYDNYSSKKYQGSTQIMSSQLYKELN
ncbi:MAG: dCTP deaminase [Eubacteriales bacterium]|nr:dCTP deaminase [Eubacteriales bacterium]